MLVTSLAHPQRGATMLEFAMVATVLFALTGGIIDFGFGIHRQHRLRDIVRTVAREVAGNGLACPDELTTESLLTSKITEILEIAPLSTAANIIDPSSALTGDIGTDYQYRRTLVTTASIPMNCFFCFFIPKQLTLTATSEEIIERVGCI